MKEKIKSKYEIWKQQTHIIIYGVNTPAGRLFDIIILVLIILSIFVVMFESVAEIDIKYHKLLMISEWVITILFTIEYILRIITIRKPWSYIRSFYGIIDLIAILPMYLSFFFINTHVLATIRSLRLLRLFRILQLMRFIGEASQLQDALKASRAKIVVFLYTVLIISVVIGSLMFIIEQGHNSGFTSVPRSIYWTIVTLTTVGYGDIAPQTELGQFIAVLIMILGYGIIAVPTGIVTVEYAKSQREKVNSGGSETPALLCPQCNTSNTVRGANFCYHCGTPLPTPPADLPENKTDT
ncbi:voltage-gated potassium channel [Sinomicrobium oceani]|uniref:Voltage-gated potassium channel n=1 Tax=Sinomicrobium oceani TaxID=1150368 RepID=A0A1K1PDN8_9FLAO|nr:ion transporter [Sinomicrobium oceani]SFW45579.1 voltage-gated potassium channel [Sinomicrobium oceani]